MVTHDRWFLDAVCTATWEVVDEQVHAYEGGYAAWTLARAERERVAAAIEARRQNLLRKEIAWLRRGPPARTSKPKFRIDAANALIADVPPARDTVSLQRLATTRLGKQVYDLEDVTLTAGDQDRSSTDLDLAGRPRRPDRASSAPTGPARPRCCGCSPGSPRPAGGRAGHRHAPCGPRSSPRSCASCPATCACWRPSKRSPSGSGSATGSSPPAQLAEVFGFTDKRVWTPVGDLSGGERRRLQLLRLLAAEPNVLLLDEPTNDLDTDTLAALEDLLDSWPGTMIVASHDRYLVERVTDTAYGMFGDGRLVHLPGGVDEYLARGPAASPCSGRTGGASARVTERDAAAPRVSSAQARKDLARLERQLAKLRGADLQDQREPGRARQ